MLPLMSPRDHLLDVGAEQQHDQDDPADDRDRRGAAQRAFGDELHGNERPVRGGDEGTALERGFQRRRLRHRLGRLYPLRYSADSVSSPVSSRFRDRTVTWRRLLAAGLSAAHAGDPRGCGFEIWRFGTSPAGASARLERQVRRDFDRVTGVLSRLADGVAADPAAARSLAARSGRGARPLRPPRSAHRRRRRRHRR